MALPLVWQVTSHPRGCSVIVARERAWDGRALAAKNTRWRAALEHGEAEGPLFLSSLISLWPRLFPFTFTAPSLILTHWHTLFYLHLTLSNSADFKVNITSWRKSLPTTIPPHVRCFCQVFREHLCRALISTLTHQCSRVWGPRGSHSLIPRAWHLNSGWCLADWRKAQKQHREANL